MSWEKVKPWEGPVYQGCLNCPPVENVADMNIIIAVGFGYAGIEKDGEVIFSESNNDDDFHRLQEFEDMAALDPDHDWRAVLDGPLRGRTYQRQEAGKWVLIESNEGFA